MNLIFSFLALVALIVASLLLIVGHNAQALVVAVLFVGLAVASGPVTIPTRRRI